MEKIDIAIVNWNSGNLIAEAVTSILQGDYPLEDISIIVIDNASSDGSTDRIPKHPSVRVIRNNENVGFATACNQAYSFAKGDYFLLLNPDTRLFTNTLLLSVAFMKSHANVTILGIKHFDDDGNVHPSCSRFPGVKDFLVSSMGLHRLFPKLFRSPIVMYDFDYQKEAQVDQVMGAFMFMRRNDIEKLQLKMDERFFVYYEDLDFSKQLKDAGGISYYTPDIAMVHKVNGTTEQIRDRRLFYNIRSRLQYTKKHFSFTSHLVISFFSLFIEPISRIIFLLAKGKVKEIQEVLKGYKMVYFSSSN